MLNFGTRFFAYLLFFPPLGLSDELSLPVDSPELESPLDGAFVAGAAAGVAPPAVGAGEGLATCAHQHYRSMHLVPRGVARTARGQARSR